ncbi:MAG: hypothetical protein ACJATI_002678 [Halioglobus sp.]|jgi:hypothetical protein
MIKEIIIGQEKFEYPIFLFEYLHSYLFRFALESGLFKGQETLDIPPNLILKARSLIGDGLRDLLTNLYEEPSHKKRSKYGSRYRKIQFEGKTYIVNFRTDPMGNTSYGISLVLLWLDKRIKELGIYEEE